MELPWLKKNNQQGGGGVVERVGEAPNMLPKVSEELLDAFHKKDHKAFREALAAFLHLVKNEDTNAIDG